MSDEMARGEIDEIQRLTRALIAREQGANREPADASAPVPEPDYGAMFTAITGETLTPEELTAISPPDQPDVPSAESYSIPPQDARADAEVVPMRRRRWPRVALGAAACLALVAAIMLSPAFRQGPALAAPPVLSFDVNLESLARRHDAGATRSSFETAAAAAKAQPVPAHTGTTQRVTYYGWSLDAQAGSSNAEPSTARRVVRDLTAGGTSTSTVTRCAPFHADGQIECGGQTKGVPATDDESQLAAGFAASLSHDPAALERQLLAFQEWDGDADSKVASLLFAITDLYMSYVLEPGLESAIWQVLANQPGFHDGGAVRDRLGRKTTALLYQDTDDHITALLAEQGTGHLVGIETMTAPASRSAASPGDVQVTDLFAFESREWVKS